jgi:integrase
VSIWTDKEGRRHVGIMLAGTRVHRICPKGASARDAKELEGRLRTALGSKREPNVPGDPMLADVMALYIKHADSLRSPDTAKHHALRVGPWVDGKRASEARQVAAEVKRLADCASASVRAAIWIAIYTGCRRGEILAIKKADIGADSILLRAGNTKTLKARTVPIIAPLRPWLEHVPLGVNFEGLKTGFRRARIAAGMPHVTFHDLRRSCATLMIQADVDLYVVSKLLGHSSVQVTQARYGYLNDAKIKEGLERTFG